MGKRTLIAFFLSLLVIISYNYFLGPRYAAPPQESGAVTEEAQLLPPEQTAQTKENQDKGFIASKAVGLGEDILVETDLAKIVITSSGARIKSCQLKEYPEESIRAEAIQEKINQLSRSIERSAPEGGEFLLREKDKGEKLLARLTQEPEAAELVSLAAAVDCDFTPALILPEDEQASLALNTGLYRCSAKNLTLSEDQPTGKLEFTFTDSLGRQVKKVYSFSNSNYSIGLNLVFAKWRPADLSQKQFYIFCGPDVGMPQTQRGRGAHGYQGPASCFQSGQQSWVQKEKYGRQEARQFVRREHQRKFEQRERTIWREILWAGLENKYFLSALIPEPTAESVVVEKNRFEEKKVGLAIPWEGSGEYKFRLYLGPKQEERLKEIGASLEKTKDYGFFGPIARFIYQILVFFSRWTNNFGWAIVLLCLVTKIVFYPLTHRSFESMQKMQQQMKTIQPEMDELRVKFKDNPQKLNKAVMELYRKRGLNPLASCQSGCLPLLLQMPVFFALYAVLYNSIELRGTPFLWWITDLSAKDPYYVLPILMGLSMFVQQKLTGMGTGGGGAQQEQAKIMAIMMPVFLTWIFASLPAGVVLYWFTFNILTSLQQLIIRKKQTATSTVAGV